VALEAAELKPCGFAGNAGIVILLYACRTWSGEAGPLEGGALGWFAPEALAGQPMPPLDYPLARQVCKLLAAGMI